MPQKPTPPTKASPRIGIPAHQPLDIIGNLQAIQQAASRPQPQAIFGLNDPNSVVGQMADVGNTILDYTVKPVNARPAETVDWSKFGQVPQGMPRFETVQPMVAPTVYHGSPHLFDMFDASKIGSGEGHQAYGHGLYFSEHPEVAQYYRDALSSHDYVVNGLPIPEASNDLWSREFRSHMQELLSGRLSGESHIEKPLVEHLDRKASQWPGVKELHKANALRQPGHARTDKLIQFYKEHVRDADPSKIQEINQGHLYHANIPDEHVDKMLHWDKQLDQQNPQIHAAMDQLIDDFNLHRVVKNWTTGSGFYKQLSRVPVMDEKAGTVELLGKKGASEELLKRGIPGIQYFDEGSRAAQKGTRNFVVFDPSIIKAVTRK